jgi:phosphatidate phosphatase PAH1
MRVIPVALALALVACDAPSGPGPDDGTPVLPAELGWCVGTAAFTRAPAQGFDHLANTVLAAGFSPRHSMQDVIAVAAGQPVVVRGKFAYGTVSKDLEDERIRVFLDDCRGWQALGDATTDADGRIALTVSRELPVGVYDVRLEVLGDASLASGRIWVLPAGTHLVVSDIDGTLTTSDGELMKDVLADFYEPILGGDFVPEAYPGAAALTQALASRGWVIVYLTGRPYWLTARTQTWLADGGFALGALHTTDSNAEALPTEGGVGAFKAAFLAGLEARGFVLDAAYGNALTDVYAYAAAGIPATSTWIIGPNAGAEGTNLLDGSWEARAADVAALEAVEQPFALPH